MPRTPSRFRPRETARHRFLPRSKPLRWLVYGAAALLLASATGALLFYRAVERGLPAIEQLANYQPSTASQVFAADGTRIGEFYFEKRYLVPLDKIPEMVRQAFIAAEDADFYRHGGVDAGGMIRAFYHNVVAGEVVQGGSTITQQVVKALLLNPERSYERKIKEILLALRIERQLSKDQILYLYLNQIYLGSGAYGVAAAAGHYFDKDIKDLSLAEAAVLAGLPQAPSRYSPIRHPERARRRQLYVLERMEGEGFITREQKRVAIAEGIRLNASRSRSYLRAPHYVEHVRRFLEGRYGGRAPYQLGLEIYTPLDLGMQDAAEEALRDGLRALDRRRGYRGPHRHLDGETIRKFLDDQARTLDPADLAPGKTVEAVVMGANRARATLFVGSTAAILPAEGMAWSKSFTPQKLRVGDVIRVRIESKGKDGVLQGTLDQEPEVEGALLALDTATGSVRAMVGGSTFHQSQFNRAVQALRQPGSAFKPFVYAAALDHEYTPASIVLDAPVVYQDWNKVWKPENYDEKWHGPTTLRDALTFSRNVVTVKVAADIGLPYLTSYLPRFGFARPFAQHLSIALGSVEVTLLELVRAYDVFATQGKLFDPIFVSRIADRSGRVLEERDPSFQQVLSPETSYLMTSLMEDVIRRGTGRRALALGRPAAGKTGTTNEHMDAWFVGYTPDLVAGVWVGFDEKRILGKKETGGRAAVPIWLDFMQKALAKTPVSDFPIPPGVVFVNIDKQTGLRAAPDEGEILLECFRRGNEPQEVAKRATLTADDFFRNDF
ncbi:MAG: penicillin-binding protein [Candidatus Binatota bacterium]|nr:penicillin-binding protein [Candidatus Binatota bacterium]